LGGCPRPGIFKDIHQDFKALKRVRTRLLVTLTAEWAPDSDAIAAYEMDSLYVPIPDLQPPTLQQADQICSHAEKFSDRGEAVVFHCHAGKGRTGTLLAAMLIRSGQSSVTAIATTRQQNHRWIESEDQLDFLAQYQSHCHKTPVA